MVSDERASAALLELLEKRQSVVLAPIAARRTRLFFRSDQGASVGEFELSVAREAPREPRAALPAKIPRHPLLVQALFSQTHNHLLYV